MFHRAAQRSCRLLEVNPARARVSLEGRESLACRSTGRSGHVLRTQKPRSRRWEEKESAGNPRLVSISHLRKMPGFAPMETIRMADRLRASRQDQKEERDLCIHAREDPPARTAQREARRRRPSDEAIHSRSPRSRNPRSLRLRSRQGRQERRR